MSDSNIKSKLRYDATHRERRKIDFPLDSRGNFAKISQFYGENTFDIRTAEGIPDSVRKEIIEVSEQPGKNLSKQNAEIVAKSVVEWAINKGATHFCHWFQPLTGSTAEKHDSFLDLKKGKAIEHLSATQLMQGEPDASSFPNGGSRSTFEARGYTAWDLTSPMFIVEGPNGKTVTIPTAFISYTGQALDVKTPLLRSISRLSQVATKFLHLIGGEDVKSAIATCGCEQEYFLIDKAFYYARPDLVMTGRTLFGQMSSRNQQLDDHYFGDIDDRVLGFMQELDLELYKLGIPAKTRHNEVAPGQYEMAPIFKDANIAADQNQMMMATIKKVAVKHDFVAILHEKPFAGINGSGKHLNWSVASDTGINLLEPGAEPENNARFLAMVAVCCEAINRHAGLVRAAIASTSNDHRLGANEAPPSIISVFLGDTLERIFQAIKEGKSFSSDASKSIDIGAEQLAVLLKDNTDRNRTSPFAFTGNKFELRAVGSSQSVGFPLSVLNAAIADVLEDTNDELEKSFATGASIEDALAAVTKKWVISSEKVVFNGDGYSGDWVTEAEARGLPNYRTTPDALPLLVDQSATKFLTEKGVFFSEELDTRYNVLIERYNTLREIEFNTLRSMVSQYVLPAVVGYKQKLSEVIVNQKTAGLESSVEVELYKKLNFSTEKLYAGITNLSAGLDGLSDDDQKRAVSLANELLPITEEIAENCSDLEEMLPDADWGLPKYADMLFLR